VDLIRRCINGKEQAHKEFYEKYAPYVYAIIKNYVKNNEQRKDALQESFAHIFSSLKNYDSQKGSIKSWIGKITVYKSIELIRRESKSNLFFGLEVVQDFGENKFDYLDHLSKNEIEDLFKKMPSGYRSVFLLSVIDEFVHKEIASLLNISEETSRSQLMRAKKWIKNNMKTRIKYLINEKAQYAKK